MSEAVTSYIQSMDALPPEALLGYLFISSNRDGAYDYAGIVEAFEANDLDPTFVPTPSGSVDAFNKTISANKETRFTLPNGNTIAIMLRAADVTKSPEYLTRAVVREELSKGQRLSYGAVGEIKLWKAPRRGADRRIVESGARFSFALAKRDAISHVSDLEIEKVRAIVGNVKGDFERLRSTLDVRKIQTIVSGYMRHLGSVRIQKALHFVPIANADEALRLAKVVSTIGECRLQALPLVNLSDQRDLILKAFQESTEDDLYQLSAELHKAAAGKPSVAVYARLRRQYDDIVARSTLYVDALGDAALRTTSAHDTALATLTSLNRALLEAP